MTFADKLKELRQAAGLTQAKLAELSGRGLGAIRDYEQGNREPLLSTAFALATALGVSVEVFAGCKGKPDESAPRGRPPKAASMPGIPPAEDLAEQAEVGPQKKKDAVKPKEAEA